MESKQETVKRARIIYFFKETFRAHYGAEYRELFSRGLHKRDTSGLSGAFPFMYIRAFFIFLMLFTLNTLVLRLTGNVLFVPSIIFLGGITFTVPFLIFLYELYPKRDLSLFSVLCILVGGGTVASVLTQIGYYFVDIENEWWSALYTGALEEISKAVVAIAAIIAMKNKNPLACYIIAAAVGCGFSVIEDMGYIYYYANGSGYYYDSEVQAIISMFFDRGFSTVCTHIVWTAVIGWAYSFILHPLKSLRFFALVAVSIGLHTMWDFPVKGVIEVLTIAFCAIAAIVLNAVILRVSFKDTIKREVDLTYYNDEIIESAKEMGVRMRYTNAANLTFALTCSLLAAFILIFCALPIGVQHSHEKFSSPEKFIEFVEGGYNLKHEFTREYDPEGYSVEKRYIEDELSYAVQCEDYAEYDGTYYYGYYIYSDGAVLDNVSVEINDDGTYSRVYGSTYEFAEKKIFAFDVNGSKIRGYTYHKYENAVTVVTDAQAFEGYPSLIALCAVGCVLSVASTVTLVTLRIKIRLQIKKEISEE